MNKPRGAAPRHLLTPDEAIHYLALDKQRLRAPWGSCAGFAVRRSCVSRKWCYVRFRQEWLDKFIDRTATDYAGILTSKPPQLCRWAVPRRVPLPSRTKLLEATAMRNTATRLDLKPSRILRMEVGYKLVFVPGGVPGACSGS